ncbi:hypothetical protein [Pseudoprimorskyibacter insulae]|uniref:Cation/multidrug efflux pump n=1 Tax=Pseudoprimorskyibacter insulae TaxID=1695997 RepID=A0A2R8AUA9_9RHOB|nr:hypothetical protein [Pseudoprimorskyibacter insulae]SPF79464.1 hypothetical protein PRI8871_01260 [Pseudoprimorskyibacter insulae]
MLALARLLIMALIALTVVYVSVSLYSRAVRRGKLSRAWDEEGLSGDRDTYIREGLEEYDRSLRRKLILGVYIVPLALVALIVYLTNFH